MIVENTYIAKLVYIENMDVYLLILNILHQSFIDFYYYTTICWNDQSVTLAKKKKFPINTVYSKNATENFN